MFTGCFGNQEEKKTVIIKIFTQKFTFARRIGSPPGLEILGTLL